MALDVMASLDRRLGIGNSSRSQGHNSDFPPAMWHYERVQVVGKGSFGQAVLIRDRRLGVHYIVKEINMSQMTQRERRDAVNEIAVLAKLNHPNIIKYHESHEQRNILFIVMEYADGGDMWTLLQNLNGRKLQESHVMNYFVQICMALKHMHDLKMLHRDLKTGNVFLTSTGVVKLGDFGISTSLMNTAAVAHTVCGTPNYFSPEMCQGRPYNNKADMWALGCILYELMAGHLAFQGATMQDLYSKIITCRLIPLPDCYSAELRHLCQRILCREQAMRPDINAVLRAYVVQKYLKSVETNIKQSQAELAQKHEQALQQERAHQQKAQNEELQRQHREEQDKLKQREVEKEHERQREQEREKAKQREKELQRERERQAAMEKEDLEQQMEAILMGLGEAAEAEGAAAQNYDKHEPLPKQPNIPSLRQNALQEYDQMLSNLDQLHSPDDDDPEGEYNTFGDEDQPSASNFGGRPGVKPPVKLAVVQGEPTSPDDLTPSMRQLLDELM